MAVFPVPGSPIRMGLFFVLRDNICNTRLISSSRPMTGSSLPFLASSTRFRAYLERLWYVSSLFWLVTFPPPLSSLMAFFNSASLTPMSFSILDAVHSTISIASRTCSTDTYSSPSFCAMSSALPNTSLASLDKYGSPPCTLGRLPIWASTAFWTRSGLTPSFWKRNPVTCSPTLSIPASKCSGSICCCPCLRTLFTASCTTSCALIVNLFMFIVINVFLFVP